MKTAAETAAMETAAAEAATRHCFGREGQASRPNQRRHSCCLEKSG
jgi:hypothetical protein